MSDLREIEAFVAVAEQGSFVAAARTFGGSSSYVSKLVKRLEERLGTRLIQRTTRRHVLTAHGELYLVECQEALRLLRHAQDRIHETSAAMRGVLRITVPTGLGLGALACPLHQFSIDHPDIKLTVNYLDRFVDLVGERYDIAVRAGALPDSSLRARRLGTFCKGVFASPDVAQAIGPLDGPEGLSGVPAVVYSGHARPDAWTLRKGDQTSTVAVKRRIEANNGMALALAAANGLGPTFLPAFHTSDHVAKGKLVRLLPEWGEQVPVHVLFPPSNQKIPLRVRTLIEHLATTFTSAV